MCLIVLSIIMFTYLYLPERAVVGGSGDESVELFEGPLTNCLDALEQIAS